jgi:hypothetical protein
MTITPRAQRSLAALFFAAVAVIYFIAWRAPSVGLYHDDGVYLVTAKSLAAGHGYTIESLPNPIPQTKYPPAFPALLALFTLVSSNTQWLKLLPVLCTLGWFILTWFLLRKMGAENSGALLLIGLTAASPAVIYVATNLMSEPLFALLVTATLLAVLDERALLAGVLAGLATLTRAAGLPLLAACFLTFLIRDRISRTVRYCLAAAIVLAPWYVWVFTHRASDPYYSGVNYANSSILTSLAVNEKLAVLATNTLFLFASPGALLTGSTNMYAAGFTLLLTIFAFWRRRQFIPDVFIGLYCAMLLCWVYPPQRFFVPILPLLLWFYWRAIRMLRPKELVFALAILAAGLSFWAGVRAVPATFATGEYPTSSAEPNDWSQMERLFAAIRDKTPPDATLVANLDPIFYLQTGRKAVRGFVPDGYKTFYRPSGIVVTPDQLLKIIESSGASYLALTPDRDFGESPAFHKAVEALERGGELEAVEVHGLAPGYRLLATPAARFANQANPY